MTGNELKQKRTAANLTQQELGEKAGFPTKDARQRIYLYESERKGITPAMEKLFTLILSNL